MAAWFPSNGMALGPSSWMSLGCGLWPTGTAGRPLGGREGGRNSAYQGGPCVRAQAQAQLEGERGGFGLAVALEPGPRVLVVPHDTAQGRPRHCRYVHQRMARQVAPLARLKPAPVDLACESGRVPIHGLQVSLTITEQGPLDKTLGLKHDEAAASAVTNFSATLRCQHGFSADGTILHSGITVFVAGHSHCLLGIHHCHAETCTAAQISATSSRQCCVMPETARGHRTTGRARRP